MTRPSPTPGPRTALQDPRPDLYRFAHKALRARLLESLDLVSRANWTDPGERRAVLEDLEETLAYVLEHGTHEDQWIHPALAARAPDVVAQLEEDHHELEHAIFALSEGLHALRGPQLDEDPAALAEAGHRLYLALADYIGHYLVHMNREEFEGQRALWAEFTDAELYEIVARLRASMPLIRLARWMEITLPSLGVNECAAFLGTLQATVPWSVFEDLVGVARHTLAGADQGPSSEAVASR
jgi:hypothetical protein